MLNSIEAVAVVLAVAYLVLAIREDRWCWPAGFGSALLFLVVFYQAGLYMESALQLFYASIAIYGWFAWGPQPAGDVPLTIHRWPLPWHGLALLVVATLTMCSGWVLARYTDASLPYLDSFVTWSAVLTTWMVARKLLENWLYWLVIDGVSVVIALERGLYQTAALFTLYLVLVVIGWRRWLTTWTRRAEES